MKQSYTVGCTHIQEHILSVPLNHFEPSGETITLFARELRILECPNSASFPLLVFFNGGPGYENTRNWTGTAWLARALKQYRVVLMDQRGTGRSSPVTEKTLTNTKDPKGLAHYLTLFRADSIVKDAEYLRHHLIGDRPWTVLGQSFGGFCVCTYLSFAAHGLERVLIAGGLPPIGQKLEDVYRYTYKTLINKNKDLYLTYPFLKSSLKKLAQELMSQKATFGNGDPFSVDRLRQLGIALGLASGKEVLLTLFESLCDDGASGISISQSYLRRIDSHCWFSSNPLYAVLHESIYSEGTPTQWAAHRVLNEFPEFSNSSEEMFLTGEMVYPWMFDNISTLKPFRECAHILAEYDQWRPLYDLEKLRKNTVPSSAIIYAEDMYVSREFSEKTAHCINGLKVWITNEFEHDGLNTGGITQNPFDRLLKLAGVY